MTRSHLAVAAMLVLGLAARAQDIPDTDEPDAPPSAVLTAIERLDAVPGRAVVIGYTRVGTVKGYFDSWLAVECQEHTDTANGEKRHGIAIDVRAASPVGRPRRSTFYVDHDEIAALLKGLDVIAKTDGRATKLDSVRVQYRTRGGLLIATMEPDTGGQPILVIGGDLPGLARAAFGTDAIHDLILLVRDAKAKLDAIRPSSPPPPANGKRNHR